MHPLILCAIRLSSSHADDALWILDPPLSSTAFEQQYNKLKNHPNLFYDYMRIIPVGTLPKIFKQSITAEMLCAVVRRPSLLSRSPLTRSLLLLGATPARGPGADVPGVCAMVQVSCLVEQYLGAHDLPLEAFKVMRALAKVNRMKTTLLSMTSAEKGQLTALFDQLENTGVDWKSAGARPSPAPLSVDGLAGFCARDPFLSVAWG
eukprot:COSAG04_NODE_1585_length_6234_cov_2.112795_2_plen_206_part_00